MTNRLQIFYFLGTLLSPGSTPNRRESIIQCLQSPDFNWSLFTVMGSNHLVLQTIYCRLRKDKLTEYLPPEIQTHLKYIYDLNYQRNSEIINQVNSINILLNYHGILPLYMKGVGNILDGLYSNLGERILYDIDILLPDEQCDTVTQILLEDGYQPLFKYDPNKRIKLKHFPPLTKSGSKISVEIHRLAVEFKYADVLGTEQIWDQKKLITNYGKCYVMCDHHKVVNNFVHSQLEHNGHVFARILLRNLYDLQLLSKREDINEDFSLMNNYRIQAACYQGIMQKVFGITSLNNSTHRFKSKLFLIRFEINLRSQLISVITFLTVNLFRTYIKLPLISIIDKELRNSLVKKLFEKNWYKRHYKSLTRINRIKAA